jgi:hypothetical protein
MQRAPTASSTSPLPVIAKRDKHSSVADLVAHARVVAETVALKEAAELGKRSFRGGRAAADFRGTQQSARRRARGWC